MRLLSSKPNYHNPFSLTPSFHPLPMGGKYLGDIVVGDIVQPQCHKCVKNKITIGKREERPLVTLWLTNVNNHNVTQVLPPMGHLQTNFYGSTPSIMVCSSSYM